MFLEFGASFFCREFLKQSACKIHPTPEHDPALRHKHGFVLIKLPINQSINQSSLRHDLGFPLKVSDYCRPIISDIPHTTSFYPFREAHTDKLFVIRTTHLGGKGVIGHGEHEYRT